MCSKCCQQLPLKPSCVKCWGLTRALEILQHTGNSATPYLFFILWSACFILTFHIPVVVSAAHLLPHLCFVKYLNLMLILIAYDLAQRNYLGLSANSKGENILLALSNYGRETLRLSDISEVSQLVKDGVVPGVKPSHSRSLLLFHSAF